MLSPACLVFELGFIFEFGYLAVWVLLGLVCFEFWVLLSFGVVFSVVVGSCIFHSCGRQISHNVKECG